MFTGATSPAGWLICDGSAISRTTYNRLFGIIGTAYGSGDGSTTFNIPNMKGRVPVGVDTSDSDFGTLGKTGGEKKHTLLKTEVPDLDINYTAGSGTGTGGILGSSIYTSSAPNGVVTLKVVNGGNAHNVLQPYLSMNYIIKF